MGLALVFPLHHCTWLCVNWDFPLMCHRVGGGGNVYEDGDFISSVAVTATSNNGRGDVPPPHEEGGEYSTAFISIRQSRITDSLNEIDLTPPPPSHDYSNVDLPGGPERSDRGAAEGAGGMEPKPTVRKRPTQPTKPTPFQRKASPGGQKPASPGIKPGAGGSPKPPRRRHSPDLPPLPPSATTAKNSPTGSAAAAERSSKPPQRNSYDPPVALRGKPPVKKKPTLTAMTKPGVYDDPDEIMSARKLKPAKPSRDNIANGFLMGSSQEDDGVVYDVPEEGVYNTPEAVYDDTGNTMVEDGGAKGAKGKQALSTVPASPKFDDGIYMDSNGSGAKKAPLRSKSK